MIHSLAGGSIQNIKFANFAKVEILEGLFAGDKYWYITCGSEQEGDIVLVPIGKNNMIVKGKVLRIDKNVSAQVSPVPIGRAKKIQKVIK